MKPIRHILIFLSMSLTFLVGGFQHAFADGGGSGGGIPSQSAPRFDPVEEYQSGLAHLKAKRYKKAQRAFKRVLSVSRKDANANYFLGIAYYAGDKVKRARKPFEKAVKYNKDNILAVGYLGAVYSKLEKDDKAKEQHDKLIELKSACDNCGELKNINSALQLIEQAKSAAPDSVSINIETTSFGDSAYISAVELINQGNYNEALSSLAKSAHSFGPHPDILTYQGFANRKLGNREQALHYYQQALSVDNNHRGANEYLGEYFVEIGDLASAQQQLAKLDRICNFGCEEAQELRRWISAASR